MRQLLLFEDDADDCEVRDRRSGSFVDNMQLPVHRWFRYSAGFSAEWAEQTIRASAAAEGRPVRVLDPFAGSGTTVLAAERAGAEAIGIEAHPFVARIARAKLLWRSDVDEYLRLANRIADRAKTALGTLEGYGTLIVKCYPPETLLRLDSLKRAWQAADDGSPVAELCRLTLISILRVTSPVGTAQWQYILPKKSKAKSVDPLSAFLERAHLIAADMKEFRRAVSGPAGRVLGGDARDCASVPDGWADLVLTSPPYANNYDYADATRLEMTFLGEVSGWGDLQATVRTHLIRSCTQHVAPYAKKMGEILAEPVLAPIVDELGAVCDRLGQEKETHGGKKQYDAMIAHYFYDLARTWQALRRAVKRGGKACFVIGDSAPYGVHVPVERWLGELALAAGFKRFEFEKIRDRNTKWKNRKHRVLLHEGRLWVEG